MQVVTCCSWVNFLARSPIFLLRGVLVGNLNGGKQLYILTHQGYNYCPYQPASINSASRREILNAILYPQWAWQGPFSCKARRSQDSPLIDLRGPLDPKHSFSENTSPAAPQLSQRLGSVRKLPELRYRCESTIVGGFLGPKHRARCSEKRVEFRPAPWCGWKQAPPRRQLTDLGIHSALVSNPDPICRHNFNSGDSCA